MRRCHEYGCATVLSRYNPERTCALHTEPVHRGKRLADELAGRRVVSGDDYAESDTTMTAADKAAYHSGAWLGRREEVSA